MIFQYVFVYLLLLMRNRYRIDTIYQESGDIGIRRRRESRAGSASQNAIIYSILYIMATQCYYLQQLEHHGHGMLSFMAFGGDHQGNGTNILINSNTTHINKIREVQKVIDSLMVYQIMYDNGISITYNIIYYLYDVKLYII